MASEKKEEKPSFPSVKDFALDFSAHGCKNVASPRRSKLARFVWFVSIVVVTGLLIDYMHNVYSAYRLYPIRTQNKVEPRVRMPMPSVTICNINPFDVSSFPFPDELRNILSSYTAIGSQLGSSFNASESPYKEILNTSIQEIVNYTTPTSFICFCSMDGNASECKRMVVDTNTRYGQCVTFNASGVSVRKTGPHSGLRFIIDVNQAGYFAGDSNFVGVKLLLHEPHEYPDVYSSGVILSAGQTSYVAVHRVEYAFLGLPYKAFGKKPCENVAGKQLEYSDTYSLSACINECVMKRTTVACNCSVTPSTRFSVCSLEQYLSCFKPKSDDFYNEAVTGDVCLCSRPCGFVKYQVQVTSAVFPSIVAAVLLKEANIISSAVKARSDFLEVNIFYENMLLDQVVHVPEYTIVSILGTVGGQMGLFLGASLLTLAELGEFIVQTTFSLARFLRKRFSVFRKKTKTIDISH